MEIKDLEMRIEKKQADIEKVNRSINKFITKNNFSEADQEFARTRNWKEISKYAEDKWPRDFSKGIDFDDLHRRYDTLADYTTQLQKYQNQLAMLKAKADKETSTEKIPVIVQFLENWKADVIKYVEDNVVWVDRYYEADSKVTDLHNNRWHLISSGKMTEEELKAAYKQASYDRKVCKANINPITDTVTWRKNGETHIDYDRLNNILDKDVNNKYWTMVNKVTDITGEITDATGLRIAGDGNLNGIIVGVNGKAKLETVLAGGYNQGVIVNVRHGQILHYRLLVHPVK